MAEVLTNGGAAREGIDDESPILVVEDVTKTFGVTTALDGVSLKVGRGDSRALIGRNGAGKSTLIALLVGLQQPDSGKVTVAGLPALAALEQGVIAFVPQHSMLFPNLTVSENVTINRQIARPGGLIRPKVTRARAVEALAGWGLDGLASAPVANLDLVQRKVVEICRATLTNPAVLLLDEPTAGLDRDDARRLFKEIERLRTKDVTIVYVSHHLHEVYSVCDTVTVLRDGQHVQTSSLASTSLDQLVTAMVGSAGGNILGRRKSRTSAAGSTPAVVSAPRAPDHADALLSVRNVTVPGSVYDVSLAVRAGECVGLAGIAGSGKVALANAVVGQIARHGHVEVNGRHVRPHSLADALASGIGLVPADRHVNGMVTSLDVSENATMSALGLLSRRPMGIGPLLIRRRVQDSRFAELQREWKIVAQSPRQLIGELSGGNQQKCVMARGLATEPQVLVLVNPTAGVDIAAKASITATLSKIISKGSAVLIVSDDEDDFELCTRILVMGRGRVAAELGADWTDDQLNLSMQEAAA